MDEMDADAMDAMDSKEKMLQAQGLMVFLGGLAGGLELLLGRREAGGLCYRSGRKSGLECEISGKQRDLFDILDAVRREMLGLGLHWKFEIWKKQSQAEPVVHAKGVYQVNLVFRNCITRCTLFRCGLPQESCLCRVRHGLFCGLFENISGCRAALEVVHAGENACLLNLKYYDSSAV